MRPAVLNPLFADVTGIKGIGPAIAKKLQKLFGKLESDSVRVLDMVLHIPVSILERKLADSVTGVKDGDVVTLIVDVEKHEPGSTYSRHAKALKPYTIRCKHPSGFINIVYFHAKAEFLAKQFPIGQKRLISGVFQRTDYGYQIAHPDIVTTPEQQSRIERLEPVYGLTYGISQQMMIRFIEACVQKLPELEEWCDTAFLSREQMGAWKQSLYRLHHPVRMDDLQPDSHYRRRMAYDELLANQLALAIVRNRTRRKAVELPSVINPLKEHCIQLLPYTLTQSQQKALQEIETDLSSGYRMLRLLQGDVGSGKTVVALLSMVHQIERGKQTSLMVPTEILARQHLAFIQPYAEKLGFTVELLTGSMKESEQRQVRSRIALGEIDMVIGTHALFQKKVDFHQLGLVVIDEQHRFGVEQRLALSDKGNDPHVLQMTATPIPRSLTMTAFGDMESSALNQKPAGRKPIDTRVIPLSREEEILQGIARALNKGDKIYWICPLIEESEDTEFKLDLAAANARYEEFKARFGPQVGLVHGRMKREEREQVMQAFLSGEKRFLVATTVIEVGVNVPDATIMVIEHAERFGLSQLHQLRGRVGRSDKASSCILLYADKAGERSQNRLRIIRDSEDGFYIAEEDLRMRGGGDVLGVQQSGLPLFRFADLALHSDMIRTARDDAKLILHHDPLLKSARGKALRTLLYLYEYDVNIRYLDGG
jgi:ATP-dependent DNA helicase RecG